MERVGITEENEPDLGSSVLEVLEKAKLRLTKAINPTEVSSVFEAALRSDEFSRRDFLNASHSYSLWAKTGSTKGFFVEIMTYLSHPESFLKDWAYFEQKTEDHDIPVWVDEASLELEEIGEIKVKVELIEDLEFSPIPGEVIFIDVEE